MLTVETLGKVRRDHFVEGKSIKSIVRARGVSRNTVRKALRSEETAFSYERTSVNRPKLGSYVTRLEGLLEANAGKSKRERLTLMRLFEQLRAEGYTGSYDAVRRYAKGWKRRRKASVSEAYVPLVFAPGEAYQLVRFDHNRYSVEARAVGRPVDVYGYAEHLAMRQDGEVVARHQRRFGRGQPVALRAGVVPQTGRTTQRRTVQRLALTGSPRPGASQACARRRRRSSNGGYPQCGVERRA